MNEIVTILMVKFFRKHSLKLMGVRGYTYFKAIFKETVRNISQPWEPEKVFFVFFFSFRRRCNFSYNKSMD